MQVTDEMLNKAISKAVQLGMIPKYASLDDHTNYYEKMKQLLKHVLSDCFIPGDIIEWAGDKFEVLENHGDSGKVKEYPDGEIIQPFYWVFEGEKCKLWKRNKERTMKQNPSDFTNYPWNSIFQNSECEVVARNIMIILKRTGNSFRKMTRGEYQSEREKDGEFTISELDIFDKVFPYCKSKHTAVLFSDEWKEE